jgi:hypothetical protein
VFLELVDHLRCVRAHEDSWLVASAYRMRERDVMDGVLGCPVCKAEYEVRDGAVTFDAASHSPAGPAGPGASGGRGDAPPADEVLRLAALTGVGEPGGFVLLTGTWAPFARPLLEIAETQLVLLNPTSPVDSGAGVTVVWAPPHAVPLAAGCLRAAALDVEAAGGGLADPVVRALAPRGRLVAPAGSVVPADVAELARDERDWVAERTGVTSAPVPLGLARRPR